MNKQKYPADKNNTNDSIVKKLIDDFKIHGDEIKVLKSDDVDHHYICANVKQGVATLLSEGGGFFSSGIIAVEFNLDEVEKVKLCIVPKNISKKLSEPRDTVATAASGGAMVGGLGGLVVGAAIGGIIEDVFHSRTTYGAEFTIKLGGGDKLKFDYLTDLIAHEKSNHLDYIRYVKQEYLPKINRIVEFTNTVFGDKVKLSCW